MPKGCYEIQIMCGRKYLINRNTDKQRALFPWSTKTLEPRPELCLDASFSCPAASFEKVLSSQAQPQASRSHRGRGELRGSCAHRTLNCEEWGTLLGERHCPLTGLQRLGPIPSSPRVLGQTLHPLWLLPYFLLKLHLAKSQLHLGPTPLWYFT